jgi:hypothetical protein
MMIPLEDYLIPFLFGAMAMLILCAMTLDAIGKKSIERKRRGHEKEELLRRLENKGPGDE